MSTVTVKLSTPRAHLPETKTLRRAPRPHSFQSAFPLHRPPSFTVSPPLYDDSKPPPRPAHRTHDWPDPHLVVLDPGRPQFPVLVHARTETACTHYGYDSIVRHEGVTYTTAVASRVRVSGVAVCSHPPTSPSFSYSFPAHPRPTSAPRRLHCAAHNAPLALRSAQGAGVAREHDRAQQLRGGHASSNPESARPSPRRRAVRHHRCWRTRHSYGYGACAHTSHPFIRGFFRLPIACAARCPPRAHSRPRPRPLKQTGAISRTAYPQVQHNDREQERDED